MLLQWLNVSLIYYIFMIWLHTYKYDSKNQNKYISWYTKMLIKTCLLNHNQIFLSSLCHYRDNISVSFHLIQISIAYNLTNKKKSQPIFFYTNFCVWSLESILQICFNTLYILTLLYINPLCIFINDT